MPATTSARIILALAAATGLTSGTGRASATECAGARDTTAAALVVYSDPPTFSTGKGWRLVRRIAELPKGITVCVIEKKTLGFIGSQREWVHIQAEKDGKPVDGWVSLRGALVGHKVTSGLLPAIRPALAFVSPAYAQEDELQDAGTPSATPFVLMVFAAILLGMAAKGLIDHLGDGVQLKTYLRDTVKAFLVSPIVFLGFAAGGDFTFSTDLGLIVFLCISFQNGFFWQTVLAKAGPLGPKPAQ